VRAFRSGNYLLSEARLEVRLAYSGFLLLALVGFASTAAFQLFHVGPTPSAIATHYLGGERGDVMTFAKTPRELMEATHFHAFTMGLVYLVLAHLLLATGASDRVKMVAIVVGFVSFAGDLAGGWLVRYGGAGFAPLLLLCWMGQWVAVGAYVYFPMWEMWFRRTR
jgi:hypothetical protein